MDTATQEIVSIMQSFSEQMDRQFLVVNQHLAKIDQQFTEMNERLEKIDQQFGEMNERFEKIDQQFGEMNERFEKIDQQFAQVNGRLDRIDVRLDSLERRMEKVEVTMVTRDYLDMRLVDQKRDMMELTRKEDKKVSALIHVLHGEESISTAGAKEILSMEPFPS